MVDFNRDFKNKDELFNFKTKNNTWLFVKDPSLENGDILSNRSSHTPDFGRLYKPEPDVPDMQEEKAKIDPLLIAAMAVAAFSLK